MSEAINKIYDEILRLCRDKPTNKYLKPSRGGCFYTEGECSDGTVGCIVGQAVLNLFPEKLDDLVWEDSNKGNLAGPTLESIFDTDDSDTVKLSDMINIQLEQDKGMEWQYCTQSPLGS